MMILPAAGTTDGGLMMMIDLIDEGTLRLCADTGLLIIDDCLVY
ncbi:hypothetical protein [Flavobacterium sp. Sd200]|nr:hypothetical protein [Flavobacterium sp. Sd200]